MFFFGCSILCGDVSVIFPVFATGSSEFNLVPGNEDILLFACRVEWHVLLSKYGSFWACPNYIFCTKNQENMQIRVTYLLYKLSKLWCCERACKRSQALSVRRQPVCRSILQPHKR